MPTQAFLVRSQNCENRLLTSSYVCLSIRKEQLNFHWTDFQEKLHLGFFSKTCRENTSVIKIRQQ
jgi:hypothetical protein